MMQDNFTTIQNRIQFACDKHGRSLSEITLIWVSKTKPLQAVFEAQKCGAIHFGENKVQEAIEKFSVPLANTELHIIGPIQSNKLRKAIAVSQWIHTFDDLDKLNKANSIAQQLGKVIHVFFQVNTSFEESKSGLSPENLDEFLSSLPHHQNLIYRGLMTIGPNSGLAEDAVEGFKWLKAQQKKWFNHDSRFSSFDSLSMGMSADLELAIECGSTHIRIGSALFGNR